mmetsp:Transcript_10750/g.28442  ORF Transcript_10750/g.28442 Transcript_10750/m.28442 type:complete len:267 (-) Transcript_10750:1322-2122(-)
MSASCPAAPKNCKTQGRIAGRTAARRRASANGAGARVLVAKRVKTTIPRSASASRSGIRFNDSTPSTSRTSASGQTKRPSSPRPRWRPRPRRRPGTSDMTRSRWPLRISAPGMTLCGSSARTCQHVVIVSRKIANSTRGALGVVAIAVASSSATGALRPETTSAAPLAPGRSWRRINASLFAGERRSIAPSAIGRGGARAPAMPCSRTGRDPSAAPRPQAVHLARAFSPRPSRARRTPSTPSSPNGLSGASAVQRVVRGSAVAPAR